MRSYLSLTDRLHHHLFLLLFVEIGVAGKSPKHTFEKGTNSLIPSVISVPGSKWYCNFCI